MELPNPTHPYRIKVILLSNDGGRTWIVSRQYYAVDLKTDKFVDIQLQGETLISPPKEGDDVR